MKNLVTGASGFLGSHVVDGLLGRGEEVRALVRETSDTAYLTSLGVELAVGNLGDGQSVLKAAKGVDRIYHCAALSADWGTWEEFTASNVTGVQNVLEAALIASVEKLVHVSTTDVYGYPDAPVDETAPYRARGFPYNNTKIEGEKLVWQYHRKKGLPITVVRPVSIYGPRSVSFVIEIVDLLKTGDMVHIAKGIKPAGLAYATNVVDLMLLAADNPKSVGQAYNACDGSSVGWREYVNRLADIVGVKHPGIVIPYRLAYFVGLLMEKIYVMFGKKDRPLLTRTVVEIFGTSQGFSIEKARRELGYEPKVDFEEGMKRVESWLKEAGRI